MVCRLWCADIIFCGNVCRCSNSFRTGTITGFFNFDESFYQKRATSNTEIQAFEKKDEKGLRDCLRSGIKINLISSVVILACLLIFDTQTIRLFNSDKALIDMAKDALPVFTASFVFISK